VCYTYIYNVFGVTLNLAESINQSQCVITYKKVGVPQDKDTQPLTVYN